MRSGRERELAGRDGAAGAEPEVPVPGKRSGTEHLVDDESSTLDERISGLVVIARRQIEGMRVAPRDPVSNAGHAWSLRATLALLRDLVDGFDVVRRDECDAVLAEGRRGLAQAEGQGTSAAAMARRGMDGEGSPLPHLAQIQASFGRHDVSRVRAHVGGPAAEANHQLGARAFAFEGQIAFASPPSLHLAAHEAAHVVQQRAGIALKSATDQAGDAYEQHADLVADAVVRGESAEPILDQAPGRGMQASDAPGIVQRKVQGSAPQAAAASGPTKPDVAWAYLRKNEARFLDSIEITLRGLQPIKDPRIAWQPSGLSHGFRAALAEALGRAPLFSKLPELLAPHDPWYAIDQNRPLVDGTPGIVVDGKEPTGPLAWSDLAGTAVASIAYEVMSESLQRMCRALRLRSIGRRPDR